MDAKTGRVLNTLTNFDTAKVLDQELPPPCPRPIRTIFKFRATKATIPEAARRAVVPDATAMGAGAGVVATGQVAETWNIVD